MTGAIPATWRVARLKDMLISKKDLTYGIVKPGDYVSDGVPIVRVKDFDQGQVRIDAPHRVSTDVERSYARSRLQGGELLVTLVGTVGLSAVAGESLAGYNVARAVAVVRIQEEIGARWLTWVLETSASSGLIAERLNTTVQPTLNLKDLRELTVPIPPKLEREGIAATLGALDDKIDSNRRVIEAAGELIHGRVRRELEQDSVTIAVADLARFVNGGAYTKGATGTGRMVIRIKELNSGPAGSTVYNDIEVPDDKVARAGAILMSWSGSLGVYRWFRDEAIINQHIFKVLPEGYPDWLVFDRLNSVIAEFQAIAKDKATTMGHIQRGHLESTRVKLPTPEAMENLHAVLFLLWERIKVAEQENQKLAALRDALLPELLSGRIRVPEAAQAVAAASS